MSKALEKKECEIIDIIDTFETLSTYSYITLHSEDEKNIIEMIDKIHKLSDKINDIFDNSY